MKIIDFLRNVMAFFVGAILFIMLILFAAEGSIGVGFSCFLSAALLIWLINPCRKKILKWLGGPPNDSWHKFVTLGLTLVFLLSIFAESHRTQKIANEKKAEAAKHAAAEAELAAKETQARIDRLNSEKPEIVSRMQAALARNDMEELIRLAKKLSPLKDPMIENLLKQSEDYLAEKKAKQARSDAVKKEKERLLAEKQAAEDAAAEENRRLEANRKRQAELAYDEFMDELHNKPVKSFNFNSKNIVEFSPPYEGGTSATLSFRNHPRFGKEIIVYISKGQLLCRSYEPCSLTIRIGDGKPFRVRAFGPADGGHDSAFIPWSFASKFIGQSDVVIALPSYENGEPAFHFDTSVLDLKRIGFN